ncbi:methyltransferase [Pseudomonas aeruginosa]|uniref:phenazine-1-carboxylate N-methyltransferase PhzM n=1 Tax=Pseudomonas aeruginosa TaxID=287 RepID=UPI00071B35DE|nr:phenazine-1-carboxylate N-methyltransferase PhzM [Pseudomonas aeruginosa]KSL69729.1 methyltransferase [Pseudomonas aeruginosa]KSM82939.1 methyltransferase [Pseudomonas aeruginosa]MDI2561119.1 phenazine-1-carboxylate N-methyltransferase PhzM [Pseudomonas aeruginosa]HBN9636387.1 phenazine-1-carboxylate N-methyltransferase PhzM [Pseudomonas aeruginosa]HCF4141031.1 phenazine-1-carboxylate N-methyltransferase PhzM [Pseudomonas aeruginosa]
MNNSNLAAARNLIQVVTGEWKSRCVYVATRLGLADLIESGIDSDETLAAAVGSDAERIHRLMRLLVAFEIFQGDTRDGYANTPTSHLLRDVEGSFRDMVLFYGEEFHAAWTPACEALLSGTPGFELAFGEDFYSYLKRCPDAGRRFLLAMKASNLAFHEIPRLLDFRGRSFVDVGGGSGELTKAILQAEPSARGVMLDREGSLGVARDNLSSLLAGERVSLEGGDMLQEVPSNGDIYLLSRIIGDLDEAASLRLLGNCREAMAGDGRVVVIERTISASEPSAMSVLWDVHLFMACAGRHRTTEEVVDLLGRGGFAVERIVDLPMETRMIVAARA